MCGILATVRNRIEHQQRLDSIKYRGSDSFNTQELGRDVIFSHSRLSINGIGAEGDQPMSSFSGRYIIIFNGEMYNFRQFDRDALGLNAGSDTRVLIESIAISSVEQALGCFDGPFALCLYDKLEQTLHFARDSFGEKPLFFFHERGSLVISSSLSSFSLSNHELDRLSLQFLNTGRCSFNHDSDGSQGLVTSAVPGVLYTYDICSDRLTLSKINRMCGFSNVVNSDYSFSSIFQAQLSNVSASEAPSGLLLSGGVDSTSIACGLRQLGIEIPAFTLGFDDERLDETAKASLVARKLGLRHEVFRLKREKLSDLFFDFVSKIDQPIGDQVALGFHSLLQQVSGSVKVALTGDGADELFSGYNKYPLYNRFSSFPHFDKLAQSLIRRGMVDSSPVKKAVLSGLCSSSRLYRLFTSNQFSYKRSDYLLSDFDFPISVRPVVNFSECQTFDLSDDLPNGLLVKSDRIGLVNNIETRSPFLTENFFESTCSNMSMHGKLPVRRYIQSSFPDLLESIGTRKQGFISPLASWLRNELSDVVQSAFALDQDELRREHYRALFTGLTDCKAKTAHAIWFYIVLIHWGKSRGLCL